MPPHHARLAALLAVGGTACAGPTLAAPALPSRTCWPSPPRRRAALKAVPRSPPPRAASTRPRRWRNPELSLDVENFAGKGPMQGLDSAETTLSLSQTLELGGKRGARIDGARRDLDLARAHDAQARADYAAALAVGYAEAEAAELRTGQARELLDAAQSDARAADLLVEAGKEARLRGLQAKADAQAAQAGLDQPWPPATPPSAACRPRPDRPRRSTPHLQPAVGRRRHRRCARRHSGGSGRPGRTRQRCGQGPGRATAVPSRPHRLGRRAPLRRRRLHGHGRRRRAAVAIV